MLIVDPASDARNAHGRRRQRPLCESHDPPHATGKPRRGERLAKRIDAKSSSRKPRRSTAAASRRSRRNKRSPSIRHDPAAIELIRWPKNPASSAANSHRPARPSEAQRPRPKDDGRPGRPGRSHRRRRAAKAAIPISISRPAACRTSATTSQKRFIEMGSNKNRRQLFNLSQAKSYMQTCWWPAAARQLIEQSKPPASEVCSTCSSTRSKAPRKKRSTTQDECDPVIEDLEVTLNSLREELHVYASNRGGMVGPITLIDSGDEIDCARMGSGGYSIPSICRAGGDPVQEVRRRNSSCTSKKTRSGGGSTKTSSGASTIAF